MSITLAMGVHPIEKGDEELVSVLLLVPRQLMRMCPHGVQKVMRRIWLDLATEELESASN